MAMGTGAKIAIGCGCLLLLGGAAVVGVVGMGAWWAKGKITEATGGLEKIAAKTDEIGRWEKQANANPYARPADGVIPEARFVKFLETRKRVYSVYERYEADLRTLQKKSEAAGDKLSPSDLWSAGGKLAEAFAEIRLAQMKALAAQEMSEEEYRDIQVAVYKSAWASDAEKQSGKMPAEAVSESMSQAAKGMEEAMRAGLEAAQKEGVPGSREGLARGREKAQEAMTQLGEDAGEGARRPEGQRRALPQVRGRHQEVRHERAGVHRALEGVHASFSPPRRAARVRAEGVRLRIPELVGQAQATEDLPHLGGLWSAGLDLEPRPVPLPRQDPELVHPDEGPQRMPSSRAPLPRAFFRPEEEHLASGEDDVLPPLCSRHQAVEQPPGGLGAAVGHREIERLQRLLTPGVNDRRLVQRGRDAESVPGAVGVVRDTPGRHPVLRRDARERRGHSDRLAVRLQHQEPLRPQEAVALPHFGHRGADCGADRVHDRPDARGGEVPVDGHLHSPLEVHWAPLPLVCVPRAISCEASLQYAQASSAHPLFDGSLAPSWILGLEAGILGDASEHSRPQVIAIVKRKGDVRPALSGQRPMGTRLTLDCPADPEERSEDA